MANPRRKFSKARTGKRRAVYYGRLEAPALMECPNCGTTKKLHRVCPACGHYRGRKVMEVEERA